MRVDYDDITGGIVPAYHMLKSPYVHIWVPKRGRWVRQTGGRGRYGENALVPLQRVKADRLEQWLGVRLGKLGLTGGFLFVPVRDPGAEYVTVGLAHDSRRPLSWALRTLGLSFPTRVTGHV